KNYFFLLLADLGPDNNSDFRQSFRTHAEPVFEYIGRSLSDFDNVLHEAEQLTANLGQQPQAGQPERASNAGLAEVASNAAPAELTEGQTPEAVEKALGEPEDIIRVKETMIYVYPTVKVFFENGKLVNVEKR